MSATILSNAVTQHDERIEPTVFHRFHSESNLQQFLQVNLQQFLIEFLMVDF